MAKRRLIDLDKIKPIDFPSTEMDGLDVVRFLNTLPTVDSVEVVHGRWTESTNTTYMMSQFTCSQCGGKHIAKTWNYCPDCGAKMDGDGDG